MLERLPHKIPERPMKPLTYREASAKMYRRELENAMARDPKKLSLVELSHTYSTLAWARAIRAADLREKVGEGRRFNFSKDREYGALSKKMDELQRRKKEIQDEARRRNS